MSWALTIHLLAAVIWVGGMFFAHMALRPAANSVLEPPQRLPLMNAVFGHFFPWVWGVVLAILGSGFWLMFTFFGGGIPLYQWVMAVLGSLMALIFIALYSLPYQQLRRALYQAQLPQAAAALVKIRRMIGLNLILGLLVIVVTVLGKYGI